LGADARKRPRLPGENPCGRRLPLRAAERGTPDALESSVEFVESLRFDTRALRVEARAREEGRSYGEGSRALPSFEYNF
jgi:hypothetical protein